jgi:hypothetical protein
MKNKMFPKLLSSAILSVMFLFIFSQKAEASENPAVKNGHGKNIPRAEALAHSAVPLAKVQPDYWGWINTHFVWNLNAKVSAPSNGKGC